MRWDLLTTHRLAALDRTIPVLLPVAATEQHGAHLPLATDRLIGEHFAAELDRRIPEKILILPAVAVGCSDHHMDFAGTLSVRHATFWNYVRDIVESVLHHGFRRIVLLNSHGGNQGIGQVILEDLGSRFPEARLVLVTWWQLVRPELLELSESGPGGTGHACELETSLVEYLAPRLVSLALVRKGEHTPTFPWAEGDMLHGARASYYRTLKAMSPSGVFGDPTLASAMKGRCITELVVPALAELITDLHTYRP